MGGETLQCCYREQLAYSLYSKFREPKLFRMAVKGDWDLIPARCRSHPKEVSFRHRYAPNDTALHRMLRPTEAECSVMEELDAGTLERVKALKLHAVEAILDANRLPASTQDAFGRTPLHLACMDFLSSGREILAAMIRASPTALALGDVEKRTPLHFLLARNEDIPLDVVELLLEACPQTVWMKDVVRETPMDIVTRRKEEIANAADILERLERVPPPEPPRALDDDFSAPRSSRSMGSHHSDQK